MERKLQALKRFFASRLRRGGVLFSLLRGAYRLLYRLGGHSEARWIRNLQRKARSRDLVSGYVIREHASFVELRDGRKFLWDPVDPNNLLGIIVRSRGEFEEKEAKLFSFLVKPGDTVFDIGANFGWYAVQLRRLMGEKGLLVAFEPVPSAFRELEKNMAANFPGASNVILEERAVGAENGTATLYVPRALGSAFGTLLKDYRSGSSETIEVRAVTLDSYLEERSLTRLDFIKCDVEGAELQVFKGARRLLSSLRAPMLAVEVNQEDSREIFPFLGGFGYEPYCFSGEELTKVASEGSTLPDYNFLFAKPAHRARLAPLIRG